MNGSGEPAALPPHAMKPTLDYRSNSLRMALSLLTKREKRSALIVLAVLLTASFTLALSVASVYPFLLVLTSPDAIATNDFLRWGHDLVGAPSHMTFAFLLGISTIAFLLSNAALQVLRIYMVERFTQMQIHSISVRLLEIFMYQPMVFFLGRNTGDMAKGILDEAREVVGQFYRPLANLVAGTLGALSVIVVLISLAPLVTIVALSVIIGSYSVVYLLTRRMLSRMGLSRVLSNSERHRISREALNGIKDIKITGTEGYFLDTYSGFSIRVAHNQSKANFINTAPRFMLEGIIFTSIVAFPIAFLDEQTLSGGDLLSGILPELGMMAIGAQRLLPEIQKMYQSISVIRFGTASLTSVYKDMSLPIEPELRRQLPERDIGLNAALEIREVSFTYPSADVPALSGINFTIRKGQRIGIVGTTGAGKSTLADIILGLLRPSAGAVLIDGVPLADSDIRVWRKAIGYVPQQIFLSDATVAENIALGAKAGKADRARIEEAARIAQLHDFITESLPNGYDTAIGENGVRLSGGQRQRIGIARALYRDADLIVFDEATSALDSVTEGEVVAAIDALPGEKTVLIIAHRLTTVRSCDRIIVMKHGRIIASGNWDENLRDSPDFRDLVARKGD